MTDQMSNEPAEQAPPTGCPVHGMGPIQTPDDDARSVGPTNPSESLRLKAYVINSDDGWSIEPADARRDWMSSTLGKAALRCLPLAMANQAGWVVKSPLTFRARWTQRKSDGKYTEITVASKEDEKYRKSIATNFGSGIVTIVLPWLFRTPPGIGLWVHAPANMPRPDVYPLEGLVETDWSPYPFTMNWKITRPKVDVSFRKGEPVCMLTPFPLDMLERIEPRKLPMANDRKLAENWRIAYERRAEEMRVQRTRTHGEFELNYMRGYAPDGEEAPVHRSNFKLKKFE